MEHVFAKPLANKCIATDSFSTVEKNRTPGEHRYGQEAVQQRAPVINVG